MDVICSVSDRSQLGIVYFCSPVQVVPATVDTGRSLVAVTVRFWSFPYTYCLPRRVRTLLVRLRTARSESSNLDLRFLPSLKNPPLPSLSLHSYVFGRTGRETREISLPLVGAVRFTRKLFLHSSFSYCHPIVSDDTVFLNQ